MGEAFTVSAKSKDPYTQVGAVVVSATNEPLGTGYNGPPSDVPDNQINWMRPDKNDFIHHAEDNAIWFSRIKGSTKGATIYTTAPPCKDCMLDIVRAKIVRVVYFDIPVDPDSSLADKSKWQITQDIAKMARVRLDKFNGNLNWLRDKIEQMKQMKCF